VAYDAETWTADEDKSREMSSENSKTVYAAPGNYDVFEKEWSQKKPSEDQLVYYGSWPDAKIVRPIIRIKQVIATPVIREKGDIMRPAKAEVMAFLKPEPVTEEERSGLERLAPGDYEIYRERLR